MSNEFITTKQTTKLSIFTLLSFIILSMIAVGAGYTDIVRFSSSFAFYFAYILGFVVSVYGAKKVGLYTYIGKALFFLGLGMFFTFIGALVWDYYDFVLNIESPYPSWADLFFAMFVFLTAISLWLFLKIYNVYLSKRIIIESIFIFIFIPSILFFIFGLPLIFTKTSAATTFFNLFYSLSDAFILTMAYIVLRTSSEKMFYGIFYLVAGLIFTATGDIIFSYRLSTDQYYFGDISDVLFIISGLIMTTGAYLIAKNFTEKKEQIR